MPAQDDVSHGDIYHKLGSLEGKLETVLIQLGEKRSDLSIIFSRIREIEGRVAMGIGIAIAFSFAMPFLIQAMSPRLHFEHPAQERAQ
jgi:hypothetical protein